MSAVDELIEICLNHPDYTGRLETSDIPRATLARAYQELKEHGDDLSGILGVAGSLATSRNGQVLVLVPLQSGGWQLRMVSEQSPQVEWPEPTPAAIERKIRELVGGRVSEMTRLRSAIESVWRERVMSRDELNSQRTEGPWESVPDRLDDEILMEAMLRYRKG